MSYLIYFDFKREIKTLHAYLFTYYVSSCILAQIVSKRIIIRKNLIINLCENRRNDEFSSRSFSESCDIVMQHFYKDIYSNENNNDEFRNSSDIMQIQVNREK